MYVYICIHGIRIHFFNYTWNYFSLLPRQYSHHKCTNSVAFHSAVVGAEMKNGKCDFNKENMGATYLEIISLLIWFVCLVYISSAHMHFISKPLRNVNRLTVDTFHFHYNKKILTMEKKKQKSNVILIFVLVCRVSLCVDFNFFFLLIVLSQRYFFKPFSLSICWNEILLFVE